MAASYDNAASAIRPEYENRWKNVSILYFGRLMDIHLIIFQETVVEAYLSKDTAYARYRKLKDINIDYDYYGIISYEIKDAPNNGGKLTKAEAEAGLKALDDALKGFSGE